MQAGDGPGLVKGVASLGGSDSKESACNVGGLGLIPGWEDPLEESMVTHSTILARRIPMPEEPGGLPHGVAKSRT